jgi:hypothetical protein
MDELAEALRSLTESKQRLKGAEDRVPRRPGLYAVHGDAGTWDVLGLGEPPDDRPLYVGKAEESLLGRDIGSHFGDGKTGQSTVRRSMAALLKGTLDLHGIPRNTAKPAYFSNYGLSPREDRSLTQWMREHLQLATWAPAGVVNLHPVEVAVIQAWEPPLNLTDVTTKWTGQVKDARKVMADEARRWQRATSS